MLDELRSVIYSIKMPEICNSLKDYGIVCDVVKSLSLSKAGSIKIIIDFGDLKISSNSLFILEQKIQAAALVVCGTNVISRLVFVGKNIQNIENHQRSKVSLEGIFKPIEGVKKIIAICSGKGGVGKSTIASNLAIKLNKNGYKVGLLDSDIYGSSIPTIFGVENQELAVKNGKLIPIIKYNISLVSIGLLSNAEVPIIWRGPMLSKALHQMFRQTNWGDLDYLIVDTPPGTGDIHISLMQNYPLTGIILVSTNDRLSEINTNKTETLFTSFGVPIISKINNMSTLIKDNQDTILFDSKIGEANNTGKPFLIDNNDNIFINTMHNISTY